ncbi:MAG: pantoate--beta-alanine ligase [Flavobacterium sp.]|nr:pantoate--beta-alanine ligase [Candidatus Neoflavobacterium equi]
MFVYNKKADLIHFLSAGQNANATVGLVPTMGALHDGHLSLLKESLAENQLTVISIFVNPTQFNNAEDLEKYPRNLDADLEKLKSLSDDIIVFAPLASEIYGTDVSAQSYQFNGIEDKMEGAARPGHFDGVGTIITKLFNIVKPRKAYFGEKDFQQLQIIRALVKNYNLPVEIIGVPIYRQEDGLAMSSRNERLSETAKTDATFIYQTLLEAQKLFSNHSISQVKDFVTDSFTKNPKFELEYFEIAAEETLETATTKEDGKKYRGFLVAHLDKIRLIDNISLN